MKKLPEIPKWIEDNYHSIKDDIPLVSVYPTEDVRVRGMLIPDVFLIEEIRATDDFKEYETVFMKDTYLMLVPQGDGREAECRRNQSSLLGSHKDNPEHVDDDDKDDEKVDEEEGGQMGSLETRNEETQTTIPTPHRSPRIQSYLQIRTLHQELMQNCIFTIPKLHLTTPTLYKHRISSKYHHPSWCTPQDV
ncbi:hypothetical protein Tco_0832358 [Tanacetum coccineum]